VNKTMMNKRTLVVGLLALSAAGWMGGAAAQEIVIRIAPPAPRVERIPPPRHGYVWVPGAWDYSGNRYVWRTGRWEAERHGYRYREDRWEQHNGGWVRVRGGWDRDPGPDHGHGHGHGHDRDRDGVPDRFDHHPNNPHRG